MLILEFFFLCSSIIPQEFTDLTQRALANAHVKIPKELRENSLHPGFYESPDFQYRLKQTLTCSNTNDVKGFARNEKHIAIVKRKSFNLKDGFVFIDPDTQKLYKLQKSVASDNNVQIYESKEVTIFDIFTDFKIHKTTWQTRKYQPVNDTSRNTKETIPLKQSYNLFWDEEKEQPEMQQIGDSDLKFGYGAYASIEAELTYSFTNIFDVKLAANLALTAVVGAKFEIPDNFEKTFNPISLFDKDIAIPSLSFSCKLLKLDVQLGAFINLKAELNDMVFKIPVGFSYYKGYKFCGSKSVLITPTEQSNFPWKFTFTDLTDENDSPSLIESLSSASFTGVVEASLNVKITIKIGSLVDATVKIGAGIPFQYTLSFDQTNCLFPYLSLSFKIPLKAILIIDPIKITVIREFTVFKGGDLISIMRTFEFGPFCMAPNLQVKQYIKDTETPNEVTVNADSSSFYAINSNDAPAETLLTITYDSKYSNKYMLFQSDSFSLSIPKSNFINEKTQMAKLDGTQIKIVCTPKSGATKSQIIVNIAASINNLDPLAPGEAVEYTISKDDRFLFYTPTISVERNGERVNAASIAFTAQPNEKELFRVNDDTGFYIIYYSVDQQYPDHLLYAAFMNIPENQDSLTFDFNQLKKIPEKITEITNFGLSILCEENVKEIIMTDPNGKTLSGTVDTELGFAKTAFQLNFADFPDLLLTFTPVCKDEKGMKCQLTLDPSESDGYQIIKYPKRDGISITGQGFLIEAIPVEAGKSYNYYKTYEESITKGKFYKKGTEYKIIPKITNDANGQKVCLHNADDDTEIFPFSRKYVTGNFDDVLDLIVSNGKDLKVDDVSSDENGCLVFSSSATLKEIVYLPKEICDIPVQQYGEKPIECVVDSGMEHCSTCEFATDGTTKECTDCDSANYVVSEDKTKCVLKECKVDSQMEHCSKCEFATDGTTKKCTACVDGYQFSSDGSECIIVEIKCIEVTEYHIEDDCVKCNADKTLCEQCSNSDLYMPDNNGKCIRKCVVGQGSCAECSEDNKKCTKCMDDEHLVVREYECICQGQYELINNQCLDLITMITPTPLPNLESFPAGSSKPDENNIQTIDTKELTNFDASKCYKEDMSASAVQLNIINNNNANLYIILPNNGKEVPIVPENENTQATLQFPNTDSFSIQLKNGANTRINADVSTATINGVKDDEATEISIGKIVPGKDKLTLNTDKTLFIKELQIFGKKGINAEENKVKIEKVKIEQGGIFIPSENLQVNNVEVGVHSQLTFNEACKDANIIIYYNRPHGDKSTFPISMGEDSEVINLVPKSLTIKRRDVDLLLDEEDFIIYAGSYNPENEEEVKKVCDKWNNVYDKSDSPFNSVQCGYQGPYKFDDEIYKIVYLYGTNIKEKKKGGLSAGAIAGIVIACVVVVGLVVGLCLYFFVFKKKVGIDNSSSQ